MRRVSGTFWWRIRLSQPLRKEGGQGAFWKKQKIMIMSANYHHRRLVSGFLLLFPREWKQCVRILFFKKERKKKGLEDMQMNVCARLPPFLSFLIDLVPLRKKVYNQVGFSFHRKSSNWRRMRAPNGPEIFQPLFNPRNHRLLKGDKNNQIDAAILFLCIYKYIFHYLSRFYVRIYFFCVLPFRIDYPLLYSTSFFPQSFF